MSTQISREEQDEFALRSHQRAVAAQEAGRFDDEIVPVEVTGRQGDVAVVDRDEHPRADTSLESLGRLRPVLRRQDPEATVTAGNASGQNDGAAACLVTTRAIAERARPDADGPPCLAGRSPACRRGRWASARCRPRPRRSSRAGLELSDMDLIELNEAFAAQVLACTREWKFAAVRLRPPQRQRLGHLARSPGRRDRRAHPGHACCTNSPARAALRPRDHVHRRRPGTCRAVRARCLRRP